MRNRETFVYLAIETLICEKRRNIGLLNALAYPYYLPQTNELEPTNTKGQCQNQSSTVQHKKKSEEIKNSNEWISQGRRFKRRHSDPIINKKSYEHSNQYGILMDKDEEEYEEYENKEKNAQTKWNDPHQRNMKNDNKYNADNVSLEDMDEVIRTHSHDIQEVTRDSETYKECKECEDIKEACGYLLGEFKRMEEYCANV